MSFNIAKRTLLSSIIAASSLSTLALAQQQEGFTVTPSIGYYNMDNDRNTKDDTAYSLGLGYQFNNPWAVEFVYLNADSTQSGGGDVDVDQYRVDGLYHLPNVGPLNLTPYLAAGVGTADFSNGASDNMQINAGGGLKYAVNDTVSLRADFRLVDDVEDHHLDNITSLGVQMTFGSPARSTSSSSASDYTEDNAAEDNAVEATQPTYTQAEPEQEPVSEPQQTAQADSTAADPIAEPVDEIAQQSPAEDIISEQPKVVVQPPANINIQFGVNKADVEQKFYPEIQKFATFLQDNPGSTVVIEGHTDDSGAASYNQTISEKRAKAIAEVLIQTFEISEDRVNAIGYGEERPLFDNDTAEHRQANRRVVAVISTSEA
ncbi:OmpA family protein [Marinomonas sp. M1K-6]|uniref:OmpA family protein n=1 Tax=Marinomonas profundi TaxID=2726122 RepID=A0A847RC72_9GAMM|nr:OmpA family protein [Marinomonas profundi]NLQ17800.1 OmpA family protein [Marinomonas profundi]UDV04355.1 OmpA family protein [Marinomonas profundi]